MREHMHRISSSFISIIQRVLHFVFDYWAAILYISLFVSAVAYIAIQVNWEIRQEAILQAEQGPCVYVSGNAYLCDDVICDLSLRCVPRGQETLLPVD